MHFIRVQQVIVFIMLNIIYFFHRKLWITHGLKE